MTKAHRKTAIELQCWQCCGHYSDGKIDCEVTTCPLYSFMPYRKKEPDLTVFSFSPRHTGKIKIEDVKRDLTEEQRQEIRDRFSRGKES
jgi:hypothetical protein